jgi:FkbM family methyltransferase
LLRQGRLRYLDPVADWETRDGLTFYPEAPGPYGLLVESRRPDGSTDRSETRFEVSGPAARSPRLAHPLPDVQLWMPSEWEAMLARGYESATTHALRGLVRRGDIAYDIGANMGFYSVQLARLVGAEGHVYAIEANPVCVYFLDVNLALNGLANVEVLPVAILDRRGSCAFTVNYHNSLVGGRHRTTFPKAGHRVTVAAIGLDELIDEHGLPPPDFVKMDIEGAETAAVPGMMHTLAARRPTLLIELHGRAAAVETLGRLAGAGYRYAETASGREFPDAEALAAWFPDQCLQVVARPP